MDDPQPWQTLETQTIFSNRWLKLFVDAVLLPDGRRYEYTRMEPGGIGVAVIGFNTRGEVLLEREYRHGIGQVVWQLPGGLAATDEDLQATGLRELMEETGHAPQAVTPENVRYLGMIWDNPGFWPAQSHIYAVWNLVEMQTTRRDPAEFVTLHWKSVEWLRQAIQDGEIQERVVVAAVAHLLLNGWLE